MAQEKLTPKQEAARIPWSEWGVAIAGALLVLSVIFYMVYLALTERGAPPDISASIESVHPTSNGYLAEITAVNKGGSTAAEVTLEAVLKDGDEDLETREVVFDFLPMHSERSAGIVFERDPGKFKVEMRVLSHREP